MKGGFTMPTFITLIRLTQKGIENVKESPARLDVAKKAFQAVGAEIKDFYLVTGQYDMVMVSEVPDHETGVKLALAIGSAGAVRTETLHAYTEDEYRKIIASLL
jgi:uncharacterized protein with GYD domain